MRAPTSVALTVEATYPLPRYGRPLFTFFLGAVASRTP